MFFYVILVKNRSGVYEDNLNKSGHTACFGSHVLL